MGFVRKVFRHLWLMYGKKFRRVETARKLGVKIGENCRFINFPQFGSEPYLIEIGDHVTLAADVLFITHDGGSWVFRENDPYKEVITFGKIKIGNNCYIGIRSTIMPGVTIGDNCVVGACSLVTKSIPAGEVWGGVPAHFIRKTEDYAEKCLSKSPAHDHAALEKDKKSELLKIYGD